MRGSSVMASARIPRRIRLTAALATTRVVRDLPAIKDHVSSKSRIAVRKSARASSTATSGMARACQVARVTSNANRTAHATSSLTRAHVARDSMPVEIFASRTPRSTPAAIAAPPAPPQRTRSRNAHLKGATSRVRLAITAAEIAACLMTPWIPAGIVVNRARPTQTRPRSCASRDNA